MEHPGSFQERCLIFCEAVIGLVEALPRTLSCRHIASQLVRSGTGVGSNVHEARGAESRADFIHKMQIALKEARESSFWLALLRRKAGHEALASRLLAECEELSAIIAKSVITARKNSAP